ncbi:EpsI family protein [Parasulfuritortus cantonensis]|uniref:EpsI family protein n=1 Tax=Parasulfuritortus cantonensis TaxID=2528202 RepID=A0A4R1BKQ6_9PROT|nr:exosortase-associated protein EpsI, B-type [Parasulfuritortus cantonensis]TCJ17933.1 EpsI family protein [Parasulfuritortus cantonensis]
MKRSLHYLYVCLTMLAAAGLANALKPTEMLADQGPKVDLETMIPRQFGDWKMEQDIGQLMVNPEVQAKVDRIYSQTLSRTYINGNGERVMLAIAYGGNQSDSMAVHKPEVCYPAQGFQLLNNREDAFSTGQGDIPIKRLVAKQGGRIEPITYWTTMGDMAVMSSSVKWKLEQIKYGLTGKIPDGLLFRISSLQSDEGAAYRLQDHFAHSLLGALTPEGRRHIIGMIGQGV